MAHSKMQLTTKISGEHAMRARRHFPAIYCLSILISFSVVLGDGKVFIWHNKDADIFQPTQKAYIKWDGSEEKLLLQTKYEGPAEEMVWIVPVPSEPKVKKGDPNAFEKLSKETQYPDLSYTYFGGLTLGAAPASGPPPRFVKWRRQIGDYDVALLSPVGAEHVIEWLNSNEFGVPEEAIPILQDYIKDQWWMVAARIHPDALTDITQEKLAEGTLHPLEMIFKAPKCVYPLRLTSLVAGPVEELIYIEGPAHYEPVTLRDDWEIDVFGGPKQKVPSDYSLSAVEHAMRIVAGKTESSAKRYLTKLRRIFKPEEMKEDIIFDKINYAKLFSSDDPIRIGEAATQYGRHRNPASVPYLLKSLSPELLDKFRPTTEEQQLFSGSFSHEAWESFKKHKEMCKHVRSCIWALGEIAIDHGTNPAVEKTLLRCAKHESQIIRMEAYIALVKLNSRGIGPILLDRFKQTFSSDLAHLIPSNRDWVPIYIPKAEMEIITEWLELFGTAQEKNTLVDILSNVFASLPVETEGFVIAFSEFDTIPEGIIWWLVWRATLTQDPRLLRPLENYRARYPDTDRFYTGFLLKAEAACGSSEAISILAGRIAKDQDKVLRDREAREKGGYASLQSLNLNRKWGSIRTSIIRKRKFRGISHLCYRMPIIEDTIIRIALSEYELDDRYVLYLLSCIEEPDAADRERIRMIWDNKDSGKQLVAVAVLWTWKDTNTLLELHKQCADEAVAAEIKRALDSLENQRD